MKFVILIHPIEARRRIATGRLSHFCLANSELILGHDYSANERVNELIKDPGFHPVILYPGVKSSNLSLMTVSERTNLFPKGKPLSVFVIDGTWATARQMVNQSQNLQTLQRVCFSPDRPSNFRVRKQPAPGCYSTIEAIHQTIELLGPVAKFPVETREHDRLIQVFDQMVEKEIHFRENARRIRCRNQIFLTP